MHKLGIPIFFVALIFILTLGVIQTSVLSHTSYNIDDSIVYSNLAGGNVDVATYSQTGELNINDYENSFEAYKKTLKINLGINDYNSNTEKSYKNVSIDEYTIYNVKGNDIEKVTFNNNGAMIKTTIENGLGTIKAPDNVTIKKTSIYSKISFNLTGLFVNREDRYSRERTVDVASKQI